MSMLPALSRAIVRSRCACSMSPLSASTAKPRASRRSASSSVAMLGAREHQHAVERLRFEDARQRIELVHAADDQ
jgi:hypothetical protein